MFHHNANTCPSNDPFRLHTHHHHRPYARTSSLTTMSGSALYSISTSSSTSSMSVYSLPSPHRCPIPESVGRTIERFIGNLAGRCGYGPVAVASRIMKMPDEVLLAYEKESTAGKGKQRGKSDKTNRLRKKLKDECFRLLDYTRHPVISTQVKALVQIAKLASFYPAVRNRFVACGTIPSVRNIPRVLVNRGTEIDEIDGVRQYVQRTIECLEENKVYDLQRRLVTEAKNDEQRSEILKQMVGFLSNKDEAFAARWVIVSSLNRYRGTSWSRVALSELFTALENVRKDASEEDRAMTVGLDNLFSEAMLALPPVDTSLEVAGIFVEAMQTGGSECEYPQASREAKQVWKTLHPADMKQK